MKDPYGFAVVTLSHAIQLGIFFGMNQPGLAAVTINRQLADDRP